MVSVRILLLFVGASIANADFEVNPGDVQVGNMVLSKEQYEVHFGNPTRRNGLYVDKSTAGTAKDYRWPNATIPVAFDSNIHQDYRQKFKDAARWIRSQTCINFLYNFNISDYPYYLRVQNNSACSCVGTLGYQKNKKHFFAFGKVCNPLREILQILGFMHMHVMPDRDDYVKINWDNICCNATKSFEKSKAKLSYYETPGYDYYSILNLSQYAASKDPHNKLKTMEPKAPYYNAIMGFKEVWSAYDVVRVNIMYECPDPYINFRYNLAIQNEVNDGETDIFKPCY